MVSQFQCLCCCLEDIFSMTFFSLFVFVLHSRITSLLAKSSATVAIENGSDRSDRFLGLTVLTDVKGDDAVMQDEVGKESVACIVLHDLEDLSLARSLVLFCWIGNSELSSSWLLHKHETQICKNKSVNWICLYLRVSSCPSGHRALWSRMWAVKCTWTKTERHFLNSWLYIGRRFLWQMSFHPL